MREIERQRGLRIAAAAALDAGGRAAQRAPTVGADNETCGDGVAVFQRNGRAAVAGFDRDGVVLDPGQRAERLRPLLQRRDQMPVLDVVAERVEADLGRRKLHLGRADEPCGGVDDAHDPQRRGLCGATGPHAKRLQRGDGTRQQRAGAVVGRRPPRDQRGFDPGLRQRNGRGQAGGAPADDRGFHG